MAKMVIANQMYFSPNKNISTKRKNLIIKWERELKLAKGKQTKGTWTIGLAGQVMWERQSGIQGKQ